MTALTSTEIARLNVGRYWHLLTSQAKRVGESANAYSGRMSQCALVMAVLDGRIDRMRLRGGLTAVAHLEGRHEEWGDIARACMGFNKTSLRKLAQQQIGFLAAAAERLGFERPSVIPDTDVEASRLHAAMTLLYREVAPEGPTAPTLHKKAEAFANKSRPSA